MARLYIHYAKYYIPKVFSAYTVSEGIIELYKKLSGVELKLFRNVPYYYKGAAAKVNTPIRLIHHGGAGSNRRIENMIYMMDYLGDEYHLTLMLLFSQTSESRKYYEFLKKLASERSNVEIIPPVDSDLVIKYTNNFDIGIYILEPQNMNHIYALPNKIFEYVQSRLCVCVSPNIEMEKIVKEYGVGITSDDYTPENMRIR